MPNRTKRDDARIQNSNRHADPDSEFQDFARIFFEEPISRDSDRPCWTRIERLTWHPFYERLQKACLKRWFTVQVIDAGNLVAEGQQHFAVRLYKAPTLGMLLPEDAPYLPGFVRNAALNIAAKLYRAHQALGVTLDLLGADEASLGSPIPIGKLASGLHPFISRDFMNGYREQCLARMDESEQLVSCFRWFLGWSRCQTAIVLGLSVAQVRNREERAIAKAKRWFGVPHETRA